jgi:hypothetical protein
MFFGVVLCKNSHFSFVLIQKKQKIKTKLSCIVHLINHSARRTQFCQSSLKKLFFDFLRLCVITAHRTKSLLRGVWGGNHAKALSRKKQKIFFSKIKAKIFICASAVYREACISH